MGDISRIISNREQELLTFLPDQFGSGGGELRLGITILSDSICLVPESEMSLMADCWYLYGWQGSC